MPINPNSAFVRVTFDLPTPVALQLDEKVRTSGKSKKQYLADLITADVANVQTGQPSTKKVRK